MKTKNVQKSIATRAGVPGVLRDVAAKKKTELVTLAELRFTNRSAWTADQQQRVMHWLIEQTNLMLREGAEYADNYNARFLVKPANG